MRLPAAIFVCLFLFFTKTIQAQDAEFTDGFIVKTGQQFVYGLVSMGTGSEKYNKVYFKASPNANAIEYHPGDIEAYGLINQNHFRSRSVRINETAQKVFIEAIVDGKAVVYTFGERFFIERDEAFYELKSAGSQSAYQTILTSVMQDCPSAVKIAKKISIELNKIIDLANTFNTCFDDGLPEKEIIRVVPEAFIGLDRTLFSLTNISNHSISGEVFRDLSLLQSGVNASFHVGNKSLALQTGIWWSDQRFSLVFRESSGSTTEVHIGRVNLKSIRVPLLFRYDFNAKEKVQWNLKGGVVFSKSLEHNTMYQSEVDENDVVTVDRYPISESLTEPTQYYFSAGMKLRVINDIYAIADVWYAMRNKPMELNAPLTGNAVAHFRSFGINLGIRLDIYAAKHQE
jgi:hypothetical protein